MEAELRASFYSLLAQAFTSPDKGWAALNNRAALSVFKKAKKLYALPAFREILESFENALRNLLKTADSEELSQEYNRLFAGIYKTLVPPYESLYRYEEGQVMAPCAIQVEKLYRENGLELSPDFKDLPDHISAELQFMAYLCLREAEAAREGDDRKSLQFIKKQDAFIKEHLGLWLDDFARKLISSTGHPFYSSAGKLVSLFVKLDRDIVSLKLRETKI